MLLSDFLKGGALLQSKAGSAAINANDLLEIGANGQLWPVQVTDFAAVANQGSAIIASTVYNAYAAKGSLRKAMFFDPADCSSYIASAISSGNLGLQIFKYSVSGALLGQFTVSAAAGGVVYAPAVLKLTNGNFAVIWNDGSVNFAIFDQYLNPVVAKTTIGAMDALTSSIDAIALSGGGFAIAYSNANPYVAIYSNAGAAVLAPALLTNAAAFGVAVNPQLVQMSNGNIAIGLASGTANKTLGYAVVTVAGASVVGCTLLNNTGAAAATCAVQISMLGSGYFCVALQNTNIQQAYVLSNAGVVQGSAYLDSTAPSGGVGVINPKLINDGTAFWFIYGTSNIITTHVAVPITGNSYVATALASTGNNVLSLDAFYERGMIVVVGASTAYIITPTPSNTVGLAGSFSMSAASAGFCARAGGDFSIVGVSGSNFFAYKYLNASIAGVSQVTLAAGNAGAIVPFGMGAGGYPCNPLLGTVGKSFDHSATNVVANKGVMLSSSVSLKGI
jgi:hypothetical protein